VTDLSVNVPMDVRVPLKPRDNYYLRLEFEVLTKVVMKSSVFWDVTPCSPTFRRSISPPSSGSACYLLQEGFLLDLFFNPEDEGYMFLRNVCRFSTE
jgi:hypothetical protein